MPRRGTQARGLAVVDASQREVWDAGRARFGSGCPLTSVSQGQPLHNQSWIRQLALGGVSLLRRAEVQAEGAVMWSEGATQRRAPVGRLALALPSWESETGGVFGPSGGRGAVPLPRLRLLHVAPVGTSPFPQRAHDGVGDISWRGGVGAQRNRGTRVGVLGGSRALLSPSYRLLPAPLPLASAAPSLLQNSFHVVPQVTLGAVVTAGGEFGDLERRVGRPLTAPLDGLQLATDAVHGVVAPAGLGRAVVHPAGGSAAAEATCSERDEAGKAHKNLCF